MTTGEPLVSIQESHRSAAPVIAVSPNAPKAIRVDSPDNIAVAVQPLTPGEIVAVAGLRIQVKEPVEAGHKLALVPIASGSTVVKYGFPIGAATTDIEPGAWVHSHNLRTRLEGLSTYRYKPAARQPERSYPASQFDGYRRADGRVGTRNEVWILNTVGCVNHSAERIAREARERFSGAVDGVYTFTHPYGCSQLGDDLGHTRKVLAGLMRNPNAGGVLLLGLGCENNQMNALLAEAGPIDPERVASFYSQDVEDEVEHGLGAVEKLVARMQSDRRQSVPASSLVIGQKCGGSDGFSGLSANPLVGRISNRVAAMGGSVLLTEVPEMFGAEEILMERAVSEQVFREFVGVIDDFKRYFMRHDQPIYENPSPGNKAGGLTTLEEKSLGAIQKGGHAAVAGVLRYGEPVKVPGLSLLEAPGNDGVSSTAMVASGATMLLFTTGRGTPLGFPAPTVKIASNSAIAQKKKHWIDFNAGTLLDGSATMDELEEDLFTYILDVASGRKQTNNEIHGVREIAIWKDGVTL